MKIDATSSTMMASVAGVQKSEQQTIKTDSPQQNKSSDSSSVVSTDNQSLDKVSIQLDVPRKTLETLQQFGQIGDFLNNMATNLRQTKEALNTSAQTIDKMKGKLDKIIKNYPPFALYSKDRMELLMSYSGLQKEIKSLMVPKPPPPIYEKVQHLWQNLFTSQDGTIPTPQLPSDAPDSHVQQAATQLDSLSGQVSLVNDALNNSIK